jgi:hypothetical protein
MYFSLSKKSDRFTRNGLKTVGNKLGFCEVADRNFFVFDSQHDLIEVELTVVAF